MFPLSGRIYELTIEDLQAGFDFEEIDAFHASQPLSFTQGLVFSRGPDIKDLQRSLSGLVGYFQSSEVLEIGPGAEDFLYEILNPYISHFPPSWHSLDINRDVVANLADRKRIWSRYETKKGTVRDIPYPDHRFDVVAGMCSLDSVVDIERAASEISRVLYPGGILVHIQDLPPSFSTLQALLARDKEVKGDAYIYEVQEGFSGGFSHVKYGDQAPKVSHLYLHEAWAKELAAKGLTNVQCGLIQYSEERDEFFSVAHRLLQKENRIISTEPYFPSYSLLIMQKGY
jgi:SAM-dependent methyltransferase